MKKLTLYLLTIVMVFFVSACGSNDDVTNTDEKANSGQVSNDVSTETPADEPTEAPTPEPTEAPTPEPVSRMLTLPSGATIPVLDKFNTEGIDFYNTFWGVPDTDETNAAMKEYLDAIERARETWATLYPSENGRQDFVRENYSMKFYLKKNSVLPSVEVVRDGICYTLRTTVPFDTEAAQRLKIYNWDDNDTARAKEALICILASFTSTPNELAEEIFNLLYEDTSAIPDDYSWGEVGDAKVSVFSYTFEEGYHEISFVIEPK